MNETINLAAASAAASAWYAAVPFRIVMIVIALLLCFAGYKLMRGVSGLFGLSCGFAGGAALVLLLPMPDTIWIELMVSVILMVILGILLGALFYRFYRMGFFLLSAAVGAALGYIPAMFVWNSSQAAAYAVMIVFAVIFGAAGAVIDKPAVIVLTSFFGFAAAFPLLALLEQEQILLQLGVGAVLTVLGMLIQFLTNRGDSKPLGTKHLTVQQDEEENEIFEPVQPQQTQPEDEIDSISDVVAANIGLSEPMTNPFDYAERADEPERVSDSTQLIDLSKHEGEVKTTVFSGDSIETVQLEDTTEEDEFAITLAGLKTAAAKENDEIALEETRVDIPTPEEQPEEKIELEIAEEQPEEKSEPEAVEERPEEKSEPEAVEERPEEKSEPEAVEERSEEESEPEAVEEQPEEESELEAAEEPPKKKRRFGLSILLPIALLAASVVFASLHIQIAEVTFLLIFLCYVLKYYRAASFACLILCVRSGLDVYIQYVQNGVSDALMQAVSAVVFLVIGIVCVWTSAAQKKDE